MSTSIIKRFSTIAGGIGANPIPLSDIIILTPLQLLLIAIIALLSGREVSKDNLKPVYEFLSAMGINVGIAYGAKALARQLVKVIPVGGTVISAGIASQTTYAVGKSAELYFFKGKNVKPEKLKKQID